MVSGTFGARLPRHGVNVAALRLLGYAAPQATVAVNLVGSLTVGAPARAPRAPPAKTAIQTIDSPILSRGREKSSTTLHRGRAVRGGDQLATATGPELRLLTREIVSISRRILATERALNQCLIENGARQPHFTTLTATATMTTTHPSAPGPFVNSVAIGVMFNAARTIVDYVLPSNSGRTFRHSCWS